MQNKDFDFIIAGAGAAGLSLLVRMIRSGNFAKSKILLVDKKPKDSNDRTWCFWEKEPGIFQELVYKSWEKISVYNEGFSKDFDIAPYRYKMIRGIDFYRYCFEIINARENITIEYGEIEALKPNGISINGRTLYADYVFNSIRLNKSIEAKGKNNLLQHFTGWIIEADTESFDEQKATLMDFRTSQQHGCSFVYVMPFSKTRALVEYTLFSKELLQPDQYAEALKTYLRDCYPGANYSIESTEFGIIPMTDFQFPPGEHSGVINIGTAGGQTKPSTGYTFQFIQKRTAEIVEALSQNNTLILKSIPLKYRFYDRVLLNVIATGKQEGSDVFTRLFSRNPSSRIFRFLDNESTLADDFRLISTLPVMPFLRASFD